MNFRKGLGIGLLTLATAISALGQTPAKPAGLEKVISATAVPANQDMMALKKFKKESYNTSFNIQIPKYNGEICEKIGAKVAVGVDKSPAHYGIGFVVSIPGAGEIAKFTDYGLDGIYGPKDVAGIKVRGYILPPTRGEQLTQKDWNDAYQIVIDAINKSLSK